MGKFKKGDRVKAITDGIDYNAGNEFVLTRDGDGENVYFVDNAGDERMRPQEEVELLPVAEATGITQDEIGKAREIPGIKSNTTTRTPLTIEAGKFYRTRDGRKVGPMYRETPNGQYLDQSESITTYGWHNNGTYIHGVTGALDLIAEWVEPVVVSPAAPTNDNAPPVAVTEPRRFKIGDKVRALVDFLWVKKGDAYVVAYLDGDGDVWLEQGDNGSAYMTDDELELITPAEETLKITSADGRTVMDVTNGVLTMEVTNIDIAAAPTVTKGRLVKTPRGYGYELARFDKWSWVDTGNQQPVIITTNKLEAVAA